MAVGGLEIMSPLLELLLQIILVEGEGSSVTKINSYEISMFRS